MTEGLVYNDKSLLESKGERWYDKMDLDEYDM